MSSFLAALCLLPSESANRPMSVSKGNIMGARGSQGSGFRAYFGLRVCKCFCRI